MGKSKQIQPQMLDSTPPELRGLRTDLASWAKTIGQSDPRSIAGMSGMETQNLDTIFGGINARSPLMDQGGNMVSRILTGEFLNPATNPGLQGSIDLLSNNAMRNLGTMQNMLDSQFVKAGMFNASPRSGEAVNLARGVQQDLTGQISELVNQNYQTGLQQIMQALGIAPQFDATQQMFGRAMAAQPLLALPRTIEQTMMDASYQHPFDIAQALSGAISGGGQMQYIMPQYRPSELLQWAQALGGIGQNAAAVKGMF